MKGYGTIGGYNGSTRNWWDKGFVNFREGVEDSNTRWRVAVMIL